MKGNRIYEIDEAGASEMQPVDKIAKKSAIRFEEAVFAHAHIDEPFDDFARQPLLPSKLSQLGPGVSWADVNGDGWDDLLVGAGKGGRLAAFENRKGVFAKMDSAIANLPVTRDQTTVLASRGIIYAGSAHYEDGLPIMAGVRQFDLRGGKVDDSLVTLDGSSGALALGDIDGDGDLDLFRGGRCLPGKYPAPASSWIYKVRNGKLELDAEGSKAFAGIGLVSGATFADFNDDGRLDLALACDWGAVRVFLNEGGTFADRTKDMGLEEFRGRWNSVAAGDFDNDGRMDLVAGNEGSNSRYENFRGDRIELIHGDFDEDGTYDVLEAHYDSRLKKVLSMRSFEVVATAMPFLKEKFASHAAFAGASVEEIFGAKLKATNRLSANWFESTVFLNRGNRFEARALPMEAQLSPVFGIIVADFDLDGAEDLFLAQNCFALPIDVSRQDAGWGLVLKGDGKGSFEALTPTESGARVAGEQRGAAAADFDGDGRMDFAVAQNAGATRLFRNVSARSGVRVTGSAGSKLRLKNGGVRGFSLGGGYWSGDSLTRVVPEGSIDCPVGARSVRVLPGGKIESIP